MSVTDIMNVSKSGIYAAQNTLQTVSHNIANANTPGYSRQSLTLQNVAGAAGKTGGGVQIAEMTRQFDKLVDRRQELGTGELGRLDARDRFLALIEQTFNDMGRDGLGQRLDAVYTAADALVDNPTNPVGRVEFVARADGLARFVRGMHKGLSENQMPVNQEITVKISDINNRLASLQKLNNTIVRNSATDPALDLRDQRRRLILELGTLVDIQTLDMPNEGIRVMTASGRLLADPVYAATLGRGGQQTETGFQGITLDGRPLDQREIRGGELGGLLEIRDQIIYGPNGFLTGLDALADEIRYQFNRVGSTSVNQSMYTKQTSAFDMGRPDRAGLLDTRLMDIPAKVEEINYEGDLATDLGRVVEGDILFASGVDADHLGLAKVHVTPMMTVREIMLAIQRSSTEDGGPVVDVVINRDDRLQFTAVGNDHTYGVVSDSSNVLAALGMGAIFGGANGGDMAVHSDLLDDARWLGVGRFNLDDPYQPTSVTFDDGNNQGALAFSDIRDTAYSLLGNRATLTAHYAESVGVLGSVIKQNQESLTAQQAAQDFIGTMRESVSGVSMEEELTDLIRFQWAFQASGKMVSVASELMQTIISMV